jgi:hypothetical protein
MWRITRVVVFVLGVVLVVSAGVVRWAVAPAVTRLPGTTDTLRTYTGTASTVINPSLLTGTLYGPALLHNQPVNVLHRITVIDTKGDNALVLENKKVTLQNRAIADVTHRYAVDRKTIGSGSGFSDVTAQTGVTFNWPIHTEKQNYTGWVSDTQTTTQLVYSGEATRGGVKTYVFKATGPAARITDPAELKGLPASLSKATLNTMTPSLGLSTDQLKQLSTVESKLPDPVPFGYLFSATSTYWVAPDSGLVVDVASHEVRTSGFVVDGQVVPVGPVLDFSYTSPPLTLQAAASDAKDKASQMKLISSTIPLGALVSGGVLILVVVGTATISRRRRTTTPPTTPPTGPPSVPTPPRELTPVG